MILKAFLNLNDLCRWWISNKCAAIRKKMKKYIELNLFFFLFHVVIDIKIKEPPTDLSTHLFIYLFYFAVPLLRAGPKSVSLVWSILPGILADSGFFTVHHSVEVAALAGNILKELLRHSLVNLEERPARRCLMWFNRQKWCCAPWVLFSSQARAEQRSIYDWVGWSFISCCFVVLCLNIII